MKTNQTYAKLLIENARLKKIALEKETQAQNAMRRQYDVENMNRDLWERIWAWEELCPPPTGFYP